MQIEGDFTPLRRQLATFKDRGLEVRVTADVDKSSFTKAQAAEKALGGREEFKLKADVDASSFAKARAAEAVLTKESSKLSDVFNRSQLSIGQWTGLLAAALPVVTDLGGALGALSASLGAATTGLAVLGVGAGAAGIVGIGGIASVAAPAISSLGDLKTATDAYTEAVQRYGKNSSQAETAMTKLRFEQQRAGPEATKFAKSLSTLTSRWKELTKAGQTDFIGVLNDGLDRLNRKLPLLAKSANRSVAALRVGFGAFLDKATGPEFNHFVDVMTRTFAKSLKPLGDAFGNIALVLERLAVAVAPDLVKMARSFDRITEGWVDATDNAKNLREVVHGLVGQTKAWFGLIQATGELITAVLVPGMGQGEKAVKGMTAQLQEWTNWVNAHPREIRDFFKEALETTKQLAQALISFLPTLLQISIAMRPIARLFLGFVKALNSIKIGDVSALTVLLGALVGSKIISGFKGLIGSIVALRGALFGAAAAQTALAASTTSATTAMTAQQVVAESSMFGGGVKAPTTVAPKVTGIASLAKYAKVAGGVAVAVTALVGAFEALRTNFLGVTDAFKGFFNIVLKPLGDAFEDLVNTISGGHAAEIFGAIGDAANALRGPLSFVVTNLTKLTGLLAIGAVSTPFVLMLTAIVGPLWVAIKGITLLVKGIKALVGALKDAFNWIKEHWIGPKLDLAAPFKWMVNAAKDAFNWVKNAIGDLIHWINDHWIGSRLDLGAPFHWMVQAAKDAFNWVKDRVVGVVDWVKDHWGEMKHTLAAPFLAVKNVVRDVFNWVKDKVEWLVDKLQVAIDKAQELKDKLPGVSIEHVGPVPVPVPHGHKGGIVTPWGIVPGFQHGGMVGRRGPRPGSRDTVPSLLEVGELVIPRKMVEEAKKGSKKVAVALEGEIGKGYDDVAKDAKRFAGTHGRLFEGLRSNAEKVTRRFRIKTTDDFQETSKDSLRKVSDLRRSVGSDFDSMRRDAIRASGGLRSGVGDDFRNLVGGVRSGLQKIAQMTNSSLKALGVKKVDFNIGGGRQRGGHIGGAGTGDIVPAMLEPGEFVVNKRATAVARPHLEALNKRVPRFAKGGIVAAGHLAEKMGLIPSEHPAFGGVTPGAHVPSSYHYKNQAIDVSGGNMKAYFNAVAKRWFGHGLAELFYDPIGRYVKLDQWIQGAIGGHSDHVHVAITSGFMGAVAKQVKRALLKGPAGPLKDLGQAVLDKVRGAANKLIQKKSAAVEGAESVGIVGDGDVERIFARAAKKLSTSKTATLALGEAGFAESGMRDLAYGDSTSQGALQLLSSTAAGMGINPHDEGAIASAFLLRGFYGRGGANKLAAQGLPAHLVAQGVQGSAFASGSNYAAQEANARKWMKRFGLQAGGLVPYLGAFHQGGWVPKDGWGFLQSGEQVISRQEGGDIHSPTTRLGQLRQRREALREEIKSVRQRDLDPKRERKLIKAINGQIEATTELMAENKALRQDIHEHNRLYKSVRANDKAALQVLSNLVSNQIGAKGLEQRRNAAPGSVVSY